MPVTPHTTRWIRRCAMALAMTALAVPAFAQTSVANFTTLTDGGLGVRYVANCYVEANLRFTVVGDPCNTSDSFASWGPSYSAYYSGSPALVNNSSTGTAVDITGATGSLFSFFSIGLAPYLGLFGGPTTVSFVGSLSGGGTVSRNITLPGATNTLTNFTFINFTSLTSLRLTVTSPASDPYVQFDNVTVGVVPEPASVLLMGIGLLSIGAYARRRRRAVRQGTPVHNSRSRCKQSA